MPGITLLNSNINTDKSNYEIASLTNENKENIQNLNNCNFLSHIIDSNANSNLLNEKFSNKKRKFSACDHIRVPHDWRYKKKELQYICKNLRNIPKSDAYN
jgi:hypothetical protein